MPLHLAPENVPEFLEAHALALLEWDSVEDHLFRIFSALVRPASPEVSSAIYHSVTTVITRLSMIDAAARVFLRDGDLYLEWRALHERVSSEGQHRTRLATFAAIQNVDSSKARLRHVEDYDARHIKRIKEWHDGFRSLAADLHGFLERVEDALAIGGAPPRLSEV